MILNKIHDAKTEQFLEKHPSVLARFGRKIGSSFTIRGMPRLARFLTPISGKFCVQNFHGKIQGELDSYIERESYIFGGYEKKQIDAFLRFVKHENFDVMLDVGANIGNHSIAFSRYFNEVHAFEPNPQVWEKFDRNCRLNQISNVILHKFGLSSRDATVPFYSIEGNNFGLGTANPDVKYGAPLKQLTDIEIKRGDTVCNFEGLKKVDFVKIDVQGLETDVLVGLSNIINRDRPIIWVETDKLAEFRKILVDAYGEEFLLYRFERERFLFDGMKLKPMPAVKNKMGNYVAILPAMIKQSAR